MAQVIKGNSTITWGAGDGDGVGTGKIQSSSHKLGGDKAELLDENGEVFSVIYYNEKNECELEVIVLSATTLPARGDTAIIGGVTGCLVDEVEIKWQNNNVKMATIRGTKYANIPAT
ncbi:MAG: hypothetical protein WCS65_16445 [Verrucomicrobiae bacterium]